MIINDNGVRKRKNYYTVSRVRKRAVKDEGKAKQWTKTSNSARRRRSATPTMQVSPRFRSRRDPFRRRRPISTDARLEARPRGSREDLARRRSSLERLSPSKLSAGGFAMDSGHPEAFDVLLKAGIQSELVLGSIARKESKDGGEFARDYLEDRVSFSEDKIMDAESKSVMMAWEMPLMEAHAKAVCSNGGHVLNVGFGMGLEDMAILRYGPASHTIVEAHLKVYQRMIKSGWAKKENVEIVFGHCQDVFPKLETYDGMPNSVSVFALLFVLI